MKRNLQTDRLILRPFTREDYDLVYAIAADEDTTRYLYYWAKMGMTVEEVYSFMIVEVATGRSKTIFVSTGF